MEISEQDKPELIAVKVVSVISPAKVTVTFQERSLTRLKALESEMARSWETSSSFCTETLTPVPSSFVAVREDRNGSCKRGLVTAVSGNTAEVFLCDYGTLVPAHNWSDAAVLAAKHWLLDAGEVAMTLFKRQSSTLIYGDFYKAGSMYPLSYYMGLEKMAMVDADMFTKLAL